MSLALIGKIISTVKTAVEVTDKVAKSIGETEKNEVSMSKTEKLLAEAVTKKEEYQELSADAVPQKMKEICGNGENVEWPYAPDDGLKVQEASEIINSTEGLRPENWERLSLDEKRSVLQDVENRLAEATNRPACEVVFEEMEARTNGYHNNGKIALNIDRINNISPDGIHSVVSTLVHEGRHEYQAFNIQLLQMGLPPIEPNLEKVESWWINLIDLGYESGEIGLFDFKKLGFKKYLAQPIEVDARVFAADVLAKVTIV